MQSLRTCAGVCACRRASWLAGALGALALAAPVRANVQLKSDTVAGFDQYVQVSEERMARDEHGGCFLVMDSLPARERHDAYEQLKNGGIFVQSVRTGDEDTPLRVPRGLIHDWVGVVFIPGATLRQAREELQDYDDQPARYSPTVRQARVLERDGEEFKNFRQLYRRQIVTVVIDANLDDVYALLSPTRLTIRSYSTRIAEVADFGEPTQHELPVGEDHGYVWRFYNYWHLEERDGGVYAQVETITLTRPVPGLLAWLINPMIRSIPRDVLSTLLGQTRSAILAHKAGETSVAGHP